MSESFYLCCLAIFLLQGVLLPWLVPCAGVLWHRRNKRMEALQKARPGIPKVTANDSREASEVLLSRLPKLIPLNCRHCGAGVLLQQRDTFCPSCRQRGELPADYAESSSLKAQAKGLLRSALRNWRTANVVTHPVAHWAFVLMIFVEPLVFFPCVLIGSNVYPNTKFDRLFASLPPTVGALVMGAAFLGFVIWMIIFILLANLSRSLRAKLPMVPATDEKVTHLETASCQACGGAVQYDEGDFACLCTYCNVENFRVQFTRRERTRSEKQATATKSVLFGAMEILDDFVATFFFTAGILVIAAVLLAIFCAIRNHFA